ncbi:hypothetical protein F4779DRAFT_427208 [Xylariaceae sp. FL0662B]|nr:hypothetical protein F4779DRAFT_427208 [Xylariaceae sp. FL0662B]
MAPYHDMRFGPNDATPLETHYSAYRKVVAGDDGNLRFLLLSTWRYHKRFWGISLRDIGHLIICPHQELNFYTISDLRSGHRLFLETAVEMALKGRGDGQEQTGACPRCATDFSVQLTPEYLKLQVWQDFGPEGYPDDLAWISQSNCRGLDSFFFFIFIFFFNRRAVGPTLYHEPGSIRKLYEPEVPKEVVEPRDKPSIPKRFPNTEFSGHMLESWYIYFH